MIISKIKIFHRSFYAFLLILSYKQLSTIKYCTVIDYSFGN